MLKVLPWQQLLPHTPQNLIRSRSSFGTYTENLVKIILKIEKFNRGMNRKQFYIDNYHGSLEQKKTITKTIDYRTYGTLHKIANNNKVTKQAFYSIKYSLIKTSNKKLKDRVYIIHLNVQVYIQIMCNI